MSVGGYYTENFGILHAFMLKHHSYATFYNTLHLPLPSRTLCPSSLSLMETLLFHKLVSPVAKISRVRSDKSFC